VREFSLRTISSALQTHLEGEVTTLAMCWRVLRADAVEKCWTDHDDVIVYDGDSYTPLESGQPSNYRQQASLAPSNQDLVMAFATGTGTDAELRAGLYDYAKVWSFLINWADTSQGIVKLAAGRLGEVEIRDNMARIEMRSLTQLITTTIGRIYTPECDADLGDARCKVVMTGYTHTGTVGTVTDRRQFTIAGAAAGKAGDYYNYGKIVFSSGACAGLTLQVEDYVAATNTIALIEPLPFDPANGDAFTLYAGCDRRMTTCVDRFDNLDNFRGFPDIPGMDQALTVPNNQQWTED
jgi:uncharacterized phage protein (TIGR02218 family)